MFMGLVAQFNPRTFLTTLPSILPLLNTAGVYTFPLRPVSTPVNVIGLVTQFNPAPFRSCGQAFSQYTIPFLPLNMDDVHRHPYAQFPLWLM